MRLLKRVIRLELQIVCENTVSAKDVIESLYLDENELIDACEADIMEDYENTLCELYEGDDTLN